MPFRDFLHHSCLAGRPLEKSAGARISPMNEGELPCRGGRVETHDRASLRFVPSGIRSRGEEIFLQARDKLLLLLAVQKKAAGRLRFD